MALTIICVPPASEAQINMCGKIVHNSRSVPHTKAVGAADSLNHTLILLLTYIQQLQLVHTVLYSLFFWQPGSCGSCGSLIIFKGTLWGLRAWKRIPSENIFTDFFPYAVLTYECMKGALSQVSSW